LVAGAVRVGEVRRRNVAQGCFCLQTRVVLVAARGRLNAAGVAGRWG